MLLIQTEELMVKNLAFSPWSVSPVLHSDCLISVTLKKEILEFSFLFFEMS